MCKSFCEAILAVIIIVFALLNIAVVSKWIVVIAAVVLLIHSFTCNKCFADRDMPSAKKRK